ncbi:hypothetical protein ABMB67_001661 [Halalkalibacter oceani]
MNMTEVVKVELVLWIGLLLSVLNIIDKLHILTKRYKKPKPQKRVITIRIIPERKRRTRRTRGKRMNDNS